jgi:hypothetical protein
MKNRIIATAISIMIMFFAWPIVAEELYVFPGKGQSQEQMEKDKYACYTWAKGETGFDPMQPPTASSPPPAQQAPTTSRLRSAARGAAVGAVVGEIANDDAGGGAAAGAAAGALFGGMRRRDQMAQQQMKEEEWARQEAANYQARRNEYNRAYTACLEAKGYTVK